MASSSYVLPGSIFNCRWTQDTRDEILRKFSWLKDREREMVVHADFDGLLSAAFMHEQCGWEVIGFYDLETVWYSSNVDEERLRRAIWVDVDIYHPIIKSVGHHVLKYRQIDKIPYHTNHNKSLNPNLLRGIYHGNFKRKYPLGTIHFLIWLFNYQPGHTQMHKLLFWHPDSSWINGQSHRYRNNVDDWLHNFVPNNLMINTFADIDTENFEQEMQNVFFPIINQAGFAKGKGQVGSRHLQLRGYQCNFDNPNNYLTKIQKLVHLICKITGWVALPIPQSYVSIQGTRNKPPYDYKRIRNNFGDLDHFLHKLDVFSYAIPNLGKMNYTNNINI